MAIISLIAAVAENNVIGKDNTIPWYLPADFKYFKETTTGHHIIMGRKTFESIGKPLPNRTSIIITNQKDYKQEGCLTAHSLEEAFALVDEKESEMFIIGGRQIYEQALPYADKLYITKVHESFEGGVVFPYVDKNTWILKSSSFREADEKNKHSLTYQIFENKKLEYIGIETQKLAYKIGFYKDNVFKESTQENLKLWLAYEKQLHVIIYEEKEKFTYLIVDHLGSEFESDAIFFTYKGALENGLSAALNLI